MMRQRIFAPNFVIFWGANAYSGCESVMRQNCELFFCCLKRSYWRLIFHKHRSVSFAQIRAKREALVLKRSNVIGLA